MFAVAGADFAAHAASQDVRLAVQAVDHAAHPLRWALARPVRLGHGGSFVRHIAVAGFCRAEQRRAHSRSGQHPALCHPLEEHHLAQQILATVNATLTGNGLMLHEGIGTDATPIAGPARPRTRMESAISRCSRPRRVISVTPA